MNLAPACVSAAVCVLDSTELVTPSSVSDSGSLLLQVQLLLRPVCRCSALACCQRRVARCHPPHRSVTGETGGGVASPQKCSGLNEHKGLISFSVRSSKSPEKEEEVISQSCSGKVQIFLSSSWTVFIPSPPSLTFRLSPPFLLLFGPFRARLSAPLTPWPVSL